MASISPLASESGSKAPPGEYTHAAMDQEVKGGPAIVRPGLGASGRKRRVIATAAIALAAVLAVVLWLALRGGGTQRTTPVPRAPSSAASIERLNAFASSVGHPVYWAGAQPSYTYELSRTKDGRVYIRYLPPGVKPGDPHPRYLTIGTYPQPHAFATLKATARKQGVATVQLAGGGLAFQYKARPTSVYLAYPGSDYQVEVFNPSATRALNLVKSGQIQPVGAPPSGVARPKPDSLTELKAFATTLGHPIYWAGPEPGTTYELTRTRTGNVYIRYLPQGAAVGDRKPAYLTIGTYPVRNALGILQATAAKNHVATIAVGNGGRALVDTKHPTSVYVAYPNLDLQIEVYDPSAQRARQLVTSGHIAPVR